MKFLMNEYVQTIGKVLLVAAGILGVQAYRTTKDVVLTRTPTCMQTATETLHGLFSWNHSAPCPVVAPGLSETSKNLVESGKVPFVDQDGNVIDRFLKKD